MITLETISEITEFGDNFKDTLIRYVIERCEESPDIESLYVKRLRELEFYFIVSNTDSGWKQVYNIEHGLQTTLKGDLCLLVDFDILCPSECDTSEDEIAKNQLRKKIYSKKSRK